ncbi:MAG: hypothetical protein KAS12_01255 [Candidatus Aenigmarchaeota archaeon]|nr:hypothetical protein [Candidatus Aenigmarchaeota archaeon]
MDIFELYTDSDYNKEYVFGGKDEVEVLKNLILDLFDDKKNIDILGSSETSVGSSENPINPNIISTKEAAIQDSDVWSSVAEKYSHVEELDKLYQTSTQSEGKPSLGDMIIVID